MFYNYIFCIYLYDLIRNIDGLMQYYSNFDLVFISQYSSGFNLLYV